MEEYDAKDVLERYLIVLRAPSKCLLRDVSELPYPKEVIKAVLTHSIELAADREIRELLKSAYISLADFQDMTIDELIAVVVMSNLENTGAVNSEYLRKQAQLVLAVRNHYSSVSSRHISELTSLSQQLQSFAETN